MHLTRRELFALTASAAFAKSHSLKFGVTDWNLRQTGQIEALSMAKRIGFAGVQISLGRVPIIRWFRRQARYCQAVWIRTRCNVQSDSLARRATLRKADR